MNGDEDEVVEVAMSRLAWQWLLSAAYMGLSGVVEETEKIEAIRTVERALGIGDDEA